MPLSSEPSALLGHESASARLWNRNHLDASLDVDADCSTDGQPSAGGEAVLDFSDPDAIDEFELLEFLASDLDPVPADPVFRERLREELWEMVLEEGIGPEKDG
jgi:hypothetical protein